MAAIRNVTRHSTLKLLKREFKDTKIVNQGHRYYIKNGDNMIGLVKQRATNVKLFIFTIYYLDMSEDGASKSIELLKKFDKALTDNKTISNIEIEVATKEGVKPWNKG